VIVDNALYRNGERVDLGLDTHDLAGVRAKASGEHDFVWVGLHDPDTDELAAVADLYDLHELAVEDALSAHQRPKVERYADSLFIVLKSLWYVDAEDAVETGEISIFVGHRFVVTVRHGSGGGLSDARHRLEEASAVLAHGPSAVVYAVCDAVVDDYSRIAFAVEEDIEEVEQRVFSPDRSNEAARIYNLKREVIEFRRAVRPLVEPADKLATGQVGRVHEHLQPFFRDVADHAVRVSEQVDGFDDLLGSVLNANLAQVAVQQNSDMRRISAWVAIVAVPTMIAGVYGMNFVHMPELGWTFGYPFALVLMAVIVGALWAFFKKSGWL